MNNPLRVIFSSRVPWRFIYPSIFAGQPRQVGTSDQDTPSVNYIDGPVQLSVRLLAFPLPSFFSFLFLGTARNMTVPVTDGRLDIHCWQASTVYDVICNVTVDNITPAEAGFYSVDIGNNVSTPERILFEIKYNGKSATHFSSMPSLSLSLSVSLNFLC